MADTRVPSTSPYAQTIGFSAAVRRGPVTVVAGRPRWPPTGTLVGGDDPRLQVLEALRKAVALLEAAGASREDVVQSRLLLARRED